MKPIIFNSKLEFRKWLDKNHLKKDELLVGFYKKGSGKANMTWSESVDEALCFGWIDSTRYSLDEESYCIRFTPRRKGSNWSEVNIRKAEVLIQKGLMHKAGLDAFQCRMKDNSHNL